uniref:RHS repeat-associated core domain-containing protein n=1 Tax=Atopomonas hussainii TaxID=1429083 RepID=UPI001114B696
VTWRAKAQAFGETQVTLNTIDNPLRFPGQYYDPETGLYYNYFRDYDPQLGRYVQADPIGLRGGVNRYAYANSRPGYATDPMGLIYRYPGNDYQQWPTGAPGCMRPVWSGGYIVDWVSCDGGAEPQPKCDSPWYDDNKKTPEFEWGSPGGDNGEEGASSSPPSPGRTYCNHWSTAIGVAADTFTLGALTSMLYTGFADSPIALTGIAAARVVSGLNTLGALFICKSYTANTAVGALGVVTNQLPFLWPLLGLVTAFYGL